MARPAHKKGSGLLRSWRATAVVLLVLILVNVAVYFAVLRPRLSMSGDTETSVAEARESLAALDADVGTLRAAVSQFGCTKSDIDSFFEDVLSVKEERLVRILRELRDIEKTQRIELGKISIRNRELGLGDIVELGLSFSFSGSYGTLREFIDVIEQSENLLIVQGVQLNEERSAGGQLKLKIQLLTYFQGPNLERFERIMADRNAELDG